MRVLGVDAGNGVILHPLKKYLIGNIEPRAIFHSKGNKQWNENFKGIPFKRDYNEDLIHWAKRGVDVIMGNPDCGHSSRFSYSRIKKLSDPRDNPSINLYLESIRVIKPKIFLMENLPKLMDIYDKRFWYETFPDYEFIFHNLSVSNFGNSQKDRIRLIIIGLNKPKLGELLSGVQYYFLNVYAVNQERTTGELLAGLIEEDLELGHVREGLKTIITLSAGFKESLKNIQKFWLENPKLKRYKVTDRKFTTAPGVYRNLDNEHPATARKANRQFNPNGLQMTPRELARIQGVPDDFKIYFEKGKEPYWINKGRATVTKTPPYEVGLWFSKQLLKSYKLWK